MCSSSSMWRSPRRTKPEAWQLTRATQTLLAALLAISAAGAPPPVRTLAQSSAADPQSAGVADRPMFEVAAIKRDDAPTGRSLINLGQSGGLLRASWVTLRTLIAASNNLPPADARHISNGPKWLDTERFDIEARAEGNPTIAQKRLMMQSLLGDRFKLIVHHETRQLPIYALVLGSARKTGPGLQQHSEAAKCFDPSAGPQVLGPTEGMSAIQASCGGFFVVTQNGNSRALGNGLSMDQLASFFSPIADRTVVNRTGLDGTFDVVLTFTPEATVMSAQTGTGSLETSAPPAFATAIREQLGLTLQPQTGPVDVLVIDHVEEPSEN
jgi:uncharacterized protein (TIGR03435 family)